MKYEGASLSYNVRVDQFEENKMKNVDASLSKAVVWVDQFDYDLCCCCLLFDGLQFHH